MLRKVNACTSSSFIVTVTQSEMNVGLRNYEAAIEDGKNPTKNIVFERIAEQCQKQLKSTPITQ